MNKSRPLPPQRDELYEQLQSPPFILSIRSRLMLLGCLLVTLALIVPFHLLGNVMTIVDNHKSANALITLLNNVDRLQFLLESNLVRESNSNISMDYSPEARSEALDLNNIVQQIETAARSVEIQPEFIELLIKDFALWKQASLRTKKRASAHKSLVETIKSFEQRIKTGLSDRGHYISRMARRTKNFVAIATVLYMFSVAALMYSLWGAIVPSFHSLLLAAYKIKMGHLDYRITGRIMKSRDEFSILGRAFNDMAEGLAEQNDKLLELNRLKTDFVSTVSHELRTPLTAIKGGLGLVLGGITGPLPKETRDMLETTRKNTDRLIRLINDVLDVSKIEAGALKLHLAKHDTGDLISHAVRSMSGYAASHKVSIRWSPPSFSPLVIVDRDRFEQIMTNLLSNAIKYSEAESAVDVSLHEEDNRIVVKISDTGPGIPADKQHLLFKKFEQLHRAGKLGEGTGLGLAICKSIVNEHGGRIWLESVEGKGSDFYFSLPWNGIDRADDDPASGSATTAA